MKRVSLLRRAPLRVHSPRRAARDPGWKPMKRSRRKSATVPEHEHLDAVASLGCLACLLDGHPGTPACIHHSRLRPDGTAYGTGCRASHFEVAPLCRPHHQGGVKGVLGRHSDEAAFVARYGDDLHLLSLTDRLLIGGTVLPLEVAS